MEGKYARITQSISVSWTLLFPRWTIVLFFISACLYPIKAESTIKEDQKLYASINVTARNPLTGVLEITRKFKGEYSVKSETNSVAGVLVHARDAQNKTTGCNLHHSDHIPTHKSWIALVERGICKFGQKIENYAVKHNASAVIVYDSRRINDGAVDDPDKLVRMNDSLEGHISVFISRKNGTFLRDLLEGTNLTVVVTITSTKDMPEVYPHYSKTSVLFVSISFIVLMIISLAWLIFYYVQRFRYAHAKERMTRRLTSAAKKAIHKIPLRTLKSGDKETEPDCDTCAVCIESFRPQEVVRTLPCNHIFHKTCVDPWLLEQRSCPICKMDILKAYGLQVKGLTPENVNIDLEATSGMDAFGASYGISEERPSDSSTEGGIQVVHIQPPLVQLHQPSTSSKSKHNTQEANVKAGCSPSTSKKTVSIDVNMQKNKTGFSTNTQGVTPINLLAASAPVIATPGMLHQVPSQESLRSSESDYNELQLLMSKKNSASTNIPPV